MTDRVTIANNALSMLGAEDGLRSLDDDKHAARTIRTVWNVVRRGMLRDHPWNFATRRALLTAAATTADRPAPIGFAHAFPLPAAPAECLRLNEILSPRLIEADYAVEGGAILADTLGPIAIRYNADVEEPSQWDALFVEGFIAKLAVAIADRVTGDLVRAQRAEGTFDKRMRRARAIDGRENPPEEYEDSSWIWARYAG